MTSPVAASGGARPAGLPRQRSLAKLIGVLGACGLVAGAGSLTACHEAAPAPDKTHVVAAPSAAQAAEPTQAVAALRISYGSRLKLGAQTLTAQLDGDLSRSAPWKRGDTTWVSYQLHEPQVLLTNGGSSKTSVDGVGSAFFVSLERPVRVALPSGSPAGAKQLLIGLVNAMRFENPTVGSSTEHWSAEERDVTGEYTASYTRAADGWIERRKERYTDVSFHIERAVAKAKLGSDGLFTQANVSERLSSPELELDSETTFVGTLTAANARLASALIGALPNGYEVIELAKAGGLAGASTGGPEKTFAAAYDELGTDKAAAFSASTLMATASGLKRHPEQTEQVVAKLRAEPQRSAALSSLLVSADVPETRAALRALLTAPDLIENAKLEILGSLLLGSSFDSQLLDAVHELALRGSVALQRGAVNVEGDLIRRAADVLPEAESAKLRSDYLERAKSCSAPLVCGAYFAGLGYIATPEAVTLLHDALGREDESGRISALRSLESVPDKRVDGWLAELVRHARGATRSRALTACAYRGSSVCLSATRELATRGTENERVGVVGAVTSGRYPAADTRSLLEGLAAHDGSATVREIARKAVERSGAAVPAK